MKLLRDEDILEYLCRPHPLVEGWPQSVIKNVGNLPADRARWLNPDLSPVQPSSLDLHIGDIYVPGVAEEERGGANKPKDSHELKPGETAVITTAEKVNFPSNVCAVGSSPTTLSFRAVLTTNTGHVDPGFSGHLRVIVINMGGKPVELNRGEDVLTLVLFELAADVARAYPKVSSPTIRGKHLERLSRDFMDLKQQVLEHVKVEMSQATEDAEKASQRAIDGAKDAVREANLRTTLWGALAVVLVTATTGIVPTCVNQDWEDRADELESQIREFKGEVRGLGPDEATRRRLEALEQKVLPGGAAAPAKPPAGAASSPVPSSSP